MTLYYEGSDGTVINLMGNGIYAQNPETLLTSVWNYTYTPAVNNLGRIRQFYKEAQASPLLLSIMADSEKQFNQIMSKLLTAFEKGIKSLKPGKLWWNDYYKEVFVFEQSHTEFDELFEAVEKTINVVSVYPFWVKEKKFSFYSQIESVGTFDYPFDFPFDYNRADSVEMIRNDCIVSSDFLLTFYGECDNPTVYMAGHEYSLDITLLKNEYAVINSKTKKIYKYSAFGVEENVFHTRNRDSYIFEKIPEGNVSVLRSKNIKFDLVLFDERGEPTWI